MRAAVPVRAWDSRPLRWLATALVASHVLVGCRSNEHRPLDGVGVGRSTIPSAPVVAAAATEKETAIGDASHYQQVAAEVVYDESSFVVDDAPLSTPPPVTILDAGLGDEQYWNLTLQETLEIALMNSTVLRDLGGTVLQSPASVRTVHGPAIEDTDPRTGVEAALSAFDAEFSTNAFFEKNDRAINNRFFGGGTRLLEQDYHVYQSQLTKRAATGSEFTLRNHTEYDANNAPGNLFGSAWQTNLEAEFRQPLLQGAGVEFNRIAGPSRTPGVYSGVVIARLNTDIRLTEYEIALRDFISNVENAYWELYFAYRDLDSKISARNATLETWRIINAIYGGKVGGEADKEARAREQYFRFEEEVQNALTGRLIEPTQTHNGSTGGTFRGNGGVQLAERRLRLLMGVPITDGRTIRPCEEPTMAEVVFDWDAIVAEAVARRPELQRQRWEVKRRELELAASKNYLSPRLDAVGRYRWRGFGKDLFDSGASSGAYGDAWGNLTDGDFQEWQMGIEFSVPIGNRRAHVARRHAELQLAREMAILREQERQIVFDLSNAIAEVERAYQVAKTNYNRRKAAREQMELVEAALQRYKATPDQVLDAQRRFADAESRYFLALVEYSLAIKNVHLEKGSLFEYNDVHFVSAGGVVESWKPINEPSRFPWGDAWPIPMVPNDAPPAATGKPEEFAPPPAPSGPNLLPGADDAAGEAPEETVERAIDQQEKVK